MKLTGREPCDDTPQRRVHDRREAPEAAGEPVSGSLPATLALGIAGSTNLGQFRLGHRVNGTFAMTQPLQVKATNAANPNTPFAAVDAPITLLTCAGPVGHDDLVVSFKQPIAVTDPLRSGVAKPLVLTLSTMSP